jgi:allantoin racemase
VTARILYINPIGTDVFDRPMLEIFQRVKMPETVVDVVSLPPDRPKHVEYHSYEAFSVVDTVRIVRQERDHYDAIVIGCFYDLGLREAREVSGKAIVTAPCQSAVQIASQLANTFSVLVGRRKWIPKMSENVRLYGYGHRMQSMRPLGLGVHDFQADTEFTHDRLLTEGRKAVEEDGAEALILGCTAEFGFNAWLQDELDVPVIDATTAPLKMAEMLVHSAQVLGWYPSRKWGSEEPPASELEPWGLFNMAAPIGGKVQGER